MSQVNIGARRQVAYALALMRHKKVVDRATLRALLPQGRVVPRTEHARRVQAITGRATGSRNVCSGRFQEALRQFEDDGWIKRYEDRVVVLDSPALYEYALRNLDDLPDELTAIKKAVGRIAA